MKSKNIGVIISLCTSVVFLINCVMYLFQGAIKASILWFLGAICFAVSTFLRYKAYSKNER